MNILMMIITVVMSIIGIISLILLIYFRLKPRILKRAAYTSIQRILQTKSHPDVKILYNEQPIENLAVVEIGFWNSGTVELKKDDISPTNRPHFKFPENCKIVSGSIGNLKDLENDSSLNISKGNNTVQYEFDYLNPGETALIQVLLDAEKPNEDLNPTLNGKYIGVPTIKRWALGDLNMQIGGATPGMFGFMAVGFGVGAYYLYLKGHWGWAIFLTLITFQAVYELIKILLIKFAKVVPKEVIDMLKK